MKRPTAELEIIGYKITDYFFKKNNGDYEKTKKEIESISIQDIEIDGNQLIIHTARPGLLIGKRGSNIDALSMFLGMKVRIEESFSWTDQLIPVDAMEYDALEFDDE
tara:strand:- start:435 stop:755 length:321 start_codon:yes stop_codon:yes gene_type:complete